MMNKSSIKRRASGRRILMGIYPYYYKMQLNLFLQLPGFQKFLKQWAPAKGVEYYHKKYVFHGWGCDVWREPDIVKLTFRSKEIAADFLEILDFKVEKLPFDRSFSKYVDKVCLEDDGRTVVALG